MKQIGESYLKYPTEKSRQRYSFAMYECPYCKKYFETMTARVKSSHSTKCKSCSGAISSTTHGKTKHRLYDTWNQMSQRCTNTNNKRYIYYGARGITICDRWLDIDNFIEDMYPLFEDGLSIDRIDVNGNYEPSNCRWTTKKVQARNTRTIMSTNKSGYRGVSFNDKDKKWVSQISLDNKKIYLGCFSTSLEAAIVYDTYVIENNLEHTTNGVIK